MKIGIRLWLDDIRPMPKDYDIWAKSADEAIAIISDGNVTHMSFDYDLGDVKETDGPIVTWDKHEKTGYDVAAWIEHQAFKKKINSFTYEIHSANTVGAKKIEEAMKRADEYWRN